MATYSVQFSVNTLDNVQANYATNTIHVTGSDLSELDDAITDWGTFYNSFSSQFGNFVKTTDGLTWKAYDLADPQPRAPVREGARNLSPDNTGSLPPEVALVLSFQAPKISGINQARRRNRIYLPFLKSSTNGTDGRPTAGVISALVGAATTLLAASGTTWDWVVYSPTIGSSSAEPVTDGWVDNEWDTQRRRGRPATSRSIW